MVLSLALGSFFFFIHRSVLSPRLKGIFLQIFGTFPLCSCFLKQVWLFWGFLKSREASLSQVNLAPLPRQHPFGYSTHFSVYYGISLLWLVGILTILSSIWILQIVSLLLISRNLTGTQNKTNTNWKTKQNRIWQKESQYRNPNEKWPACKNQENIYPIIKTRK